jgi:hypothetical protein
MPAYHIGCVLLVSVLLERPSRRRVLILWCSKHDPLIVTGVEEHYQGSTIFFESVEPRGGERLSLIGPAPARYPCCQPCVERA